jgi:hypothetical protein
MWNNTNMFNHQYGECAANNPSQIYSIDSTAACQSPLPTIHYTTSAPSAYKDDRLVYQSHFGSELVANSVGMRPAAAVFMYNNINHIHQYHHPVTSRKAESGSNSCDESDRHATCAKSASSPSSTSSTSSMGKSHDSNFDGVEMQHGGSADQGLGGVCEGNNGASNPFGIDYPDLILGGASANSANSARSGSASATFTTLTNSENENRDRVDNSCADREHVRSATRDNSINNEVSWVFFVSHIQNVCFVFIGLI